MVVWLNDFSIAHKKNKENRVLNVQQAVQWYISHAGCRGVFRGGDEVFVRKYSPKICVGKWVKKGGGLGENKE